VLLLKPEIGMRLAAKLPETPYPGTSFLARHPRLNRAATRFMGVFMVYGALWALTDGQVDHALSAPIRWLTNGR